MGGCEFRLAVCSIDRTNSEQATLNALDDAGKRGVDLMVLPEEPDIVAGKAPGRYRLEEHPLFQAFQEKAREYGTGVVGSLSARVEGGFANTGFLIDRAGKPLGTYRKKHPAPGEEDIVTEPAGEDPFPVFEFETIRIGIGICMDIHSPEMFRIYGLKGADLVCLPTMYLDYTGDMLETLEKARAIDSQMYFSLSRYIEKPFLAGRSVGYAKVISPDGRIIASTGHREGVAIAEFDPKWRMPFWGEGYGGSLRVLFDTVRRPEFYKDLIEAKHLSGEPLENR